MTTSQVTLAIEEALRECERRGFLRLLRPSLTIDAACYLRDQFGRTKQP